MTIRTIARAAWILPVLLFGLTVHQGMTARSLNATLTEGEQAVAQVTRYERSDRKDVTHVSLDLTVELADGSIITKENLALPYSIGHRVEADSLDVRVLPGTAQEVVITSIGRTHVSIALSNALFAFVIFVMAFIGVRAWNRHLDRKHAESTTA